MLQQVKIECMKKLIILFLILPYLGMSQGKLDRAKGELSSRTNGADTTEDYSSDNNSYSSGSSSGNALSQAAAELFLLISYKIAFGNLEARYFAPYPYYFDNVNGEYDFGYEKGDKNSVIGIEVNYLLGSAANAIEADINYRFVPFLGLDLNHQSFFEQGLNGLDYLDVTSLMLNYYRFRERYVTGWFGAGVTYVGDGVDAFGAAYNLGLHIYPFRPFSVSVAYKQSFINSSQINTVKYQLNYHLQQWAFYLGYHHTSLGGVKVSGAAVGIKARL